MFVSVESTVAITGGEGGMYLATDSTISSALVTSLFGPAHGLGIAIAADLLNQMFGGLHAAGAFEMSLPISSVGPLAAILDLRGLGEEAIATENAGFDLARGLFLLAKVALDSLLESAKLGGAAIVAATALGGDFGIHRGGVSDRFGNMRLSNSPF